uniref:cyclin-dependent kinase n=2 Tax=Acrobeloides nanus TaxID=290746 RepID=A0A914EAY7_9BILA
MDDAPYFKTVPSSEDEGELSGSDEGSRPKIRSVVNIREKEEARLREKLLEKQKSKHKNLSGDEDEMFSMQPEKPEKKKEYKTSDKRERSSQSSRSSSNQPSKYSEKEEVNRQKESKHKRIEWDRDADRLDKRDRERDVQSYSRKEKRDDYKERGLKRDEQKESHRHKKEDDRKTHREVHKDSPRKRQHSSSHEHHRSEKHAKKHSHSHKHSEKQKTPVKKEPSPEQTVVSPEREKIEEIRESTSRSATSTPSESSSKEKMSKKKYSKFESSPESMITDDERNFPVSDNLDVEPIEIDEMVHTSDEEHMDVLDVTAEFDLDGVNYEDLSEEQKARISPLSMKRLEDEYQQKLIAKLPVYYPGISGCRNVSEFECLNRIEEGTFGVVYRAKEKRTDEVVALKRLKMEKEREGFPITSLREVNMLLKCGKHENVVNVREIVVGSNMDRIYLVMEYVEHDMKSLMELMRTKKKSFTIGQVKTLLRQLLSGVNYMHEEWVIHRDLKTSNLLLSHEGVLKIGDFGLAREYGDPLKPYTPIVVTLWYRSPELLLGVHEYSTAVDIWSVGCIFGEFLKLHPLFPGKGEIDQLNKIFMELGTPSENIWPGYNDLPLVKKSTFGHYPYNQLRKSFGSDVISDKGFKLLNRFLTYNPETRISASEALANEWFSEDPQPTPRENFPTWPAKSEQNKAPPPKMTDEPDLVLPKQSAEQIRLMKELKVDPRKASAGGFALRFDAPRF